MNQRQRTVEYMKKNGSITQLEATKEFGALRLSAIIYDLKNKDGYNIKKEMVKGKNRFDEETHFARYSFIEQDEEIMKHIPSI